MQRKSYEQELIECVPYKDDRKFLRVCPCGEYVDDHSLKQHISYCRVVRLVVGLKRAKQKFERAADLVDNQCSDKELCAIDEIRHGMDYVEHALKTLNQRHYT